MTSEVVSIVERQTLLDKYDAVLTLLQQTFWVQARDKEMPQRFPVHFSAWNERDETTGWGQMRVSIEFAGEASDPLPTEYYVHDRARPFPCPDNPWSEGLITGLGDLAITLCKADRLGKDEAAWEKLRRGHENARVKTHHATKEANETLPATETAEPGGATVIVINFGPKSCSSG